MKLKLGLSINHQDDARGVTLDDVRSNINIAPSAIISNTSVSTYLYGIYWISQRNAINFNLSLTTQHRETHFHVRHWPVIPTMLPLIAITSLQARSER